MPSKKPGLRGASGDSAGSVRVGADQRGDDFLHRRGLLRGEGFEPCGEVFRRVDRRRGRDARVEDRLDRREEREPGPGSDVARR